MEEIGIFMGCTADSECELSQISWSSPLIRTNGTVEQLLDWSRFPDEGAIYEMGTVG